MSNHFEDALVFFIGTFSELAALFILISFVVSLIHLKLPANKVKQLLSGNRGYGIAVALGAITPFCSCSTLPMTTGLIQARAAFGPIMAFLFTSPLLNPFILILFWASFGATITLVYACFVLALAILSGFLLDYFNFARFIRSEILQGSITSCQKSDSQPGNSGSANGACSKPPQTSASLQTALPWKILIQDAIKQFISFTPYMVLGVAIGAIIHGYIPQSLIESLAGQETWWLIPLAALVGVFLYIRASTMVPIAASLAAKGLSFGVIMSLTIGGAGASLPEMIMMRRIFLWPLIAAFIGLVFTTACVTGYVVNWLNLGLVS